MTILPHVVHFPVERALMPSPLAKPTRSQTGYLPLVLSLGMLLLALVASGTANPALAQTPPAAATNNSHQQQPAAATTARRAWSQRSSESISTPSMSKTTASATR